MSTKLFLIVTLLAFAQCGDQAGNSAPQQEPVVEAGPPPPIRLVLEEAVGTSMNSLIWNETFSQYVTEYFSGYTFDDIEGANIGIRAGADDSAAGGVLLTLGGPPEDVEEKAGRFITGAAAVPHAAWIHGRFVYDTEEDYMAFLVLNDSLAIIVTKRSPEDAAFRSAVDLIAEPFIRQYGAQRGVEMKEVRVEID